MEGLFNWFGINFETQPSTNTTVEYYSYPDPNNSDTFIKKTTTTTTGSSFKFNATPFPVPFLPFSNTQPQTPPSISNANGLQKRYDKLQNKINAPTSNLPQIPQPPKIPPIPKPSPPPLQKPQPPQTLPIPEQSTDQTPPIPLTCRKVMSISIVVFAMSVAFASGLALSHRWMRA